MATYAQRVASQPCSKVEIITSCKNLLDKDITSKSDPCLVLYMQDKGQWYEVGRTENVQNCLNPQFAHIFEVDYYFEEVQNLNFAIYDLDNSTPQLSDDDFLGQHQCTLGQIVSGSPYTKPLLLRNGKNAGKGTITIQSAEVAKLQDVLHLSFRATKLDKKDTFSKSDPYLEFYRGMADGSWSVVHRTEVIDNNLNPTWRPFQIKAQKLCAGDYNRQIKVSCFDHDENDDCDLIGEFTTNIPEMLKAVDQEVQWDCIHPKKKAKKKSYKNSGVVHLTSLKITKEYSFLDYIFGGLQLNFTVGVDFTASNGKPSTPQSLHYINPYQPNEYMKAIQSVGAVIQDYDSDQQFPALGFGAKLPSGEVSHEFALNFNPANPFCTGIQGVLAAYSNCVRSVQLYGPTNFSPIINHVSQFAQAEQQKVAPTNYFTLLIITDGVITDMPETLCAIVRASQFPMSIIIVGVGDADFTAMDKLDSDDKLLKDPYGGKASRDIVQFVPMRDFANAPPAALAKHVLAEVPQQVTAYYKIMNIAPSPAGSGAQPGPGQPPAVPPTQPMSNLQIS